MAKVLIVDDDRDIAESTREILQSAGHHVQTRYDGKQGLKSLGEGDLPDCVVLDVDLPVLSGPAMVHQMLIHDAGEEKIPVVLVSARTDLSTLARRTGTPYFLAKACDNDGARLLTLVDRALGERQAPTRRS